MTQRDNRPYTSPRCSINLVHNTNWEPNLALEQLDTLQSQFENLEFLAFADLSSKLVLLTSSSCSLDRAALDTLARDATLCLSGFDEPSIGAGQAASAVRRTSSTAELFVRNASEPTEALICVGSTALDTNALLPAALACLEEFGQK